MALTSDQRKKLDAFDKALTKAQDSLPSVTPDTDQASARDALRPHLFVPPTVARELLDERAQFTAAVMRGTYQDDLCKQWDRELKRLDPLLTMRRAYEAYVIGTPLLPGHYHLIRENPGAPPSVTPVRGPDGGFAYPPGNLLESLKRCDLQDVRVMAERKREMDRAEYALQRQKEHDREVRQDETMERWRAVSRTQISMNPDMPWAQNAAGLRRTKGRHKPKED